MKRTVSRALAMSFAAVSLAQAGEGFDVVSLGARGGIQDGNLSAYLVRPHGDPHAVACDVGALVNGLRIADEKGVFQDIEVPEGSTYTRVGHMLVDNLKGYLVSHAHLDHIAGLIAASPDDGKKPIYALPSVNADIEQTYFNWEAWPNFGDRGKEPQLKKYEYRDLAAGAKAELTGTAMHVTPYPLSHGGVESTAFLIESGDDALLCFGDTGPDAVEKSTRMAEVWAAVADRLQQKRLKAIIIETSYTNAQPDDLLFGHLTPAWLLKSLKELEAKAGAGSLKDLPVVVSHIKYSLKTGPSPQEEILAQLQAGNDLGVNFIIPEQGMAWRF